MMVTNEDEYEAALIYLKSALFSDDEPLDGVAIDEVIRDVLEYEKAHYPIITGALKPQ